MHKRFASKGLKVVAIQGAKPRKGQDPQERIDKVAKFIEGQKVPYPVLLDPKAAYYESLDLPAGPYPIALLLDAAGRVVWITPRGAQSNRTAGIGVQFSELDNGATRNKIENQLAGALKSDRQTHTM